MFELKESTHMKLRYCTTICLGLVFLWLPARALSEVIPHGSPQVQSRDWSKPEEIDAFLNVNSGRKWPGPILTVSFKTVVLHKEGTSEGTMTSIANVKCDQMKTLEEEMKLFDVVILTGYGMAAAINHGAPIKMGFVNFESPAGKASVALALDEAKLMLSERTKPAAQQDSARIRVLESNFLHASLFGPMETLLSK
jgi:hypothetical protein